MGSENITKKSKLVVPDVDGLRLAIMEWLHGSGSSGHSGRDATHQRVKSLFYWKGMSKYIHAHIRRCTVF